MSHDVVIAGAGPTGLMLACELSLAGVRPLVLEALPERPADRRANGLVGQVVRMVDRRGLYGRLGGPGRPQPAPRYMFGGLPLDLSVLPDNPLYVLPVPQRRIEEVLEERAVELGAQIRRGHRLTGLTQDADAVTAEVTGPDGGYELRTRYLVGADGGHSATRGLTGIGFPGVSRDHTVSRSAHVTVPAELVDPVTGGLDVPGYGVIPPFLHHRTESGVFVYAPFPATGTAVTTMEWDASGDPDPAPPTLEELRAAVRRVLGVDLPLHPPTGAGPHLLRRLTGGNTRLADRYRDGRVLLVGDAAHVHSAVGGPGLNLGLQDAINVGWKLAAEVHGWAAPGLLDSYEAERRPVAQRVVMHSQAQSALLAPGSEVTALRELMAELLREPGNVARLADLLAAADVRYPTTTPEAHELAGRWAPDLVLDTGAGPVRLAELTRGARPLLLDLTDDAALSGVPAGWADRVDVVAARAVGAPAPARALLVRPDGYVAWATGSARPGEPERAALRTALTTWFGCPATDRAQAGSAL
ncbi:FAD-dependent monooxygenase [Pseudonocardia kunmingensis]|uniref:2-polyprenyl-6-methoxyphenol hydroxylase-like FAD-dependent oxidoreductase n=1 Tax=Pseudonocardia kunmingensis TaxID=630975 RepID=A0A543D3M9_9PSEU|nr:FAD-dependent monooxygenase [Pseudonocardia kunmingensis]TQM03952.1 2-polyprenyl-6-methoxyphenol hydroxylase-like FAD-dependent oxidoreductase [Pseudonocardia kunmingensis]